MPTEPSIQRAVAFVDGQNLFHSAAAAFGYKHPDFDVKALAGAVCAAQDWIRIDRATYDRSVDTRDYRPKQAGNSSSGLT